MGNTTRDAILQKMKAKQGTGSQEGFWGDLMSRIKQGVVIPIISNSFRVEHVFREVYPTTDEAGLSPYEQLTKDWAGMIEYPMEEDGHNLARVAQYYLVNEKDEAKARNQFYEFLKSFLLDMAEGEPAYAATAGKLRAQMQSTSFAEIASQLDYPRFENTDDPVHLLAQLPLPIYITTSQSDFLERALTSVGKRPRTQVCFWSQEIRNDQEIKADADFVPDKDNPLVYHLFGFEKYPQTLVLSEDDYMNFLIAVVENKNTQVPVVPLSLHRALGASQLMLLGYRLQDWDFRVLFRFILKFQRAYPGMLIQLTPSEKQEILQYLKNYFGTSKFDVEWSGANEFVQTLWNKWEAYEKSS